MQSYTTHSQGVISPDNGPGSLQARKRSLGPDASLPDPDIALPRGSSSVRLPFPPIRRAPIGLAWVLLIPLAAVALIAAVPVCVLIAAAQLLAKVHRGNAL